MERAWSLFLLLTAGAQSAPGLQVFKCVEEGRVSYQSIPCDGALEEKRWSPPPQVPISPDTATGRGKPVPARRKEHHPGTVSVRRHARSPIDACTRAREGRDAAYRKVGLKRGFALSSHWDNRVHDACR